MKINRIEKLEKIAERIGVKATIKENGGDYFACVNTVTFRVVGYEQFEKKCYELINYTPPKPVDLTARLALIEGMAFKSAKRMGVI